MTFIIVGAVSISVVLVTSVMLLRTVPAVALGLIGAVVGAGVAVLGAVSDGHPKGAPAIAAVGATMGLCVFGLVGLHTMRARAPAKTLRRASLFVLIAAPFAATILALVLLSACPLYVQGGVCHHGADVLGGWITGVVVVFGFDALVLAGLLLFSADQNRITSH